MRGGENEASVNGTIKPTPFAPLLGRPTSIAPILAQWAQVVVWAPESPA